MTIETVKNIAAIFGCASTVFGFILMISKTARGWIANLFKKKQDANCQQLKLDGLINKWDRFIETDAAFKNKIQEDLEVQKEFAKAECRATIKDIFYKYCNDKRIPLYEFKTAASTYQTYTEKLKGNSYITLLFEEIKKWEIDYTHSFEEDDE